MSPFCENVAVVTVCSCHRVLPCSDTIFAIRSFKRRQAGQKRSCRTQNSLADRRMRLQQARHRNREIPLTGPIAVSLKERIIETLRWFSFCSNHSNRPNPRALLPPDRRPCPDYVHSTTLSTSSQMQAAKAAEPYSPSAKSSNLSLISLATQPRSRCTTADCLSLRSGAGSSLPRPWSG